MISCYLRGSTLVLICIHCLASSGPRGARVAPLAPVGREGGRGARGIAGSCPLVSRVTAPVLRARVRISSLVRKGGCRGESQAQPTYTHSHARTYAPGTHARTHARTREHKRKSLKGEAGECAPARAGAQPQTATHKLANGILARARRARGATGSAGSVSPHVLSRHRRMYGPEKLYHVLAVASDPQA